MDNIEYKIHKMGYSLPIKRKGSKIESAKVVGNLVFISGQGCDIDGQLPYIGRVGAEVTLEEGYECARICALNTLAAFKRVIGDLELIDEIVKVLGFVNSADNFHDQPKVMDGYTDFMIEVFGERGRHARSAIGTNNLPNNQPVEVESIIKIKV